MTEPVNWLFALGLYKIHDLRVSEGRVVSYQVTSQIVFFSAPNAEYARIVYSDFLEPGWSIGAVEPVPAPAQMRPLFADAAPAS